MTTETMKQLFEIESSLSHRFIAQNHYAILSPSSVSIHLGLLQNGQIKAVCQLGYGTRPKATIKALFSSLDTKDYFEICRLCLLEELPRNSESQFIKQVIGYIRKHHPEKKLVFTWADGLRGKPGFIYQASNFLYGGYIWSEFYATQDGEVIHPRLLITRYKTRSLAQTRKLGLVKYWGMQFRYIKFLCSHKEQKRLLAESPIKWAREYPKISDLQFKVQAGEGSRENCQLPKLKGAGQFRHPAPLFQGAFR